MSLNRTPNPGNQSVYIMEDGMDDVCAAALDQQTQSPTVTVPFVDVSQNMSNYYSQTQQPNPAIIYQGKLLYYQNIFFFNI